MPIFYSDSRPITVDEFIDVLRRSTLAERRPVEDRKRMESMLAHANLMCTAWRDHLLVGVARSLTDFGFCCYLSDLAVDKAFQKQGIGKGLIQVTRDRLDSGCKLILLAAPKAEGYYPHIGFSQHPSAWVL